MSKNERIFRILAVAGFGLGVYALIRYEIMIYKLTEVVDGIEQLKIDTAFEGLVNRYDDEGEN